MTQTELQTELLKILWTVLDRKDYTAETGEQVCILQPGEYDPENDRFCNAEIRLDDAVYRGEIVIRAEAQPEIERYDHCILHVAPQATSHLCRQDGTLLPQIVVECDKECLRLYETFRHGRSNAVCGNYLAALSNCHRVDLFTRLTLDRLQRKCGDLFRIHDECERNWHETMYVMLLRTMGDSRNKEAFTELARRVGYAAVSRERDSLLNVEALLLGTSGLLEKYEEDGYIRTLKEAFDYLRNKYSIRPLPAGLWDTSRNNPFNHPVIRLAQLAAFLSTQEFLFDNLIRCRTVEDVHNLFRAEASEYWSTHFIPSGSSAPRPKRIGSSKADLLGINLVVPMQFAYGDYLNDEELKDRALGLLERIWCEDNRIVQSWRERGVVMESAFDTQAILQLNNEYCLKGRCSDCAVGRGIIKNSYMQRFSK